jgi:hypothetical protein
LENLGTEEHLESIAIDHDKVGSEEKDIEEIVLPLDIRHKKKSDNKNEKQDLQKDKPWPYRSWSLN